MAIEAFLKDVKSVEAPGVKISTKDAGEQQTSSKAPSNDELALQATPQAALPFIDDLEVKRADVAKFGGDAAALLLQIDFLKHQLTLLRFAPEAEETYAALVRHLAVYQILYNFENTYRRIFGTQVELLYSLNNEGKQTTDSLRTVYREVRLRYRKFYAAYSFEQWIGFLHSQGAIASEGDGYVISHFGHEFCKWMIDNRVPSPPH